MANRPGWYPRGQAWSPPDLPPYLRNVYDLKPINGVPSDDEVTGIHAVIQVANRASGIPGMHDPNLLMKLADHLFSVQMAKHQDKYLLATFLSLSNATYTPPDLPGHIPVNLEPVSGAPSDDEMIKVQEALRSYQQFSHVPSMFDAHLNTELSQHLFDLQMARYMQRAGESGQGPAFDETARVEGSTQQMGPPSDVAEETNNAGNHAATVLGQEVNGSPQMPRLASSFDMGQSNPQLGRNDQSVASQGLLADRFNQVLERFSQLIERACEPSKLPDRLADRLDQVFDRFNQVAEQSSQSILQIGERSNQLMQQSNQLVEQLKQPVQQSNKVGERFNQLLSQISPFMQQSNQLAERLNQIVEGFSQPLQRSNQLSEKANQLIGKLDQSFERSNKASEQTNGSIGQLRDVLKNTNRVLAKIQHAIIRNQKGNALSALDCLTNDKGETPSMSLTTFELTFNDFSRNCANMTDEIPLVINGESHNFYINDRWLGNFLCFYGIGDGMLESPTSTKLITTPDHARRRLREYLTSCLG